ncbi:hypothetical protein, partial [Klebsiella pneumoniae]|uniref:hypothetical protein n=1 Tax=Klebsiella pneumoniae TaxID=573 RepID=UPI0029DC471C
GTVCVVGKIRALILQLSKSSIYSTKPSVGLIEVRMSRAVDYLPDEFTKQATEDKLLHHGKKEKLLSFLGT